MDESYKQYLWCVFVLSVWSFSVPIHFHYMEKNDQDILQKLPFYVLWNKKS